VTIAIQAIVEARRLDWVHSLHVCCTQSARLRHTRVAYTLLFTDVNRKRPSLVSPPQQHHPFTASPLSCLRSTFRAASTSWPSPSPSPFVVSSIFSIRDSGHAGPAADCPQLIPTSSAAHYCKLQYARSSNSSHQKAEAGAVQQH